VSRWPLPAVVAGFWLGCALTAARPPARLFGIALVGVAGAAVLAARSVRGAGACRSRLLLRNAAMLRTSTERSGPRERILSAAGLGSTAIEAAPRSPTAIVVIVAAAVAAGAGWASVRSPPRLGSLDGRHVRFVGTAASDVALQEWGWTLEVRLERISVGGRVLKAQPKAWITASPPAPAVGPGQPVAGTGTLEEVARPADGFDAFLAGRGITARLRAARLEPRGPPGNPALRVANSIRDAYGRGASEALRARSAGPPCGLAIGDTAGMAPEVDEDFRASGLAHLLAVSGSNVALVLAPVLAATGRLRPGRRALAGLAAVSLFALVTRWEPSVLRAGAMAALALVALWAGRPRRVGPALATAVIVLLVVDPFLATSVGFQLSVAATAALAVLAGPVAARLSWLPRPVAGAAAATIAAQIGVTPLLLLLFGSVPTVTLLANVLAFPAVGVALFLGSMAAGLALVWPSGGAAVGNVAELPLGYLAELADRMARFPLPSLTGGVVAAAVTAVAAVVVGWRLRRPGGTTVVAAAVVVAAVAWSSAPGAGPPTSLTVTFLDVGQGDAAVVRTPDGATVLVDAGPDEREVAVDLAALGVERIDVAVASHAHSDHVEGFPAVLARFPVGLLLEPGCPGDSPSYDRFLRSVKDEGVPVRHPRGGQHFTVGRLRIEVLGPDRCSPGGSSPNDDSVVVRVSYGRASVLFPGDAEVAAQRDLLADDDPVVATVLKVPHHGGDTSDEDFFDTADAAVAVVSTGPNDYGHPVPSVLDALRANGMAVYRTDHAGEVTVTFAADGSPVVASSR
jgi:competence protein ComEC